MPRSTHTSSSNRRNPPRARSYQGSYVQQTGRKNTNYSRSRKQFVDPESSRALLATSLRKKGGKHVDLLNARNKYKRKAMGAPITREMKKDAKSTLKRKRTHEQQRVLEHPNAGLAELGVERNHKNANSQVATLLTASASTFLGEPSAKRRKKAGMDVKNLIAAHIGDRKPKKEKSGKIAQQFIDGIEVAEAYASGASRVRAFTKVIEATTAEVADNKFNLVFGAGQRKPKPSLKIVIPPRGQDMGSNQDVGSFWDGNRTPKGSLTPRSQQIFDGVHEAANQGLFSKRMANAATTRPKYKSTNVPFGSLKQKGK